MDGHDFCLEFSLLAFGLGEYVYSNVFQYVTPSFSFHGDPSLFSPSSMYDSFFVLFVISSMFSGGFIVRISSDCNFFALSEQLLTKLAFVSGPNALECDGFWRMVTFVLSATPFSKSGLRDRGSAGFVLPGRCLMVK